MYSMLVPYLYILLNRNIYLWQTTSIYDKRDDFNFTIVHFSLSCSDIPLLFTCGEYVSQLIRYARTCSVHDPFLSRVKLLTSMLLLHGYKQSHLKATFSNFYGRYNNLHVVRPYSLPLSQMLSDLFQNQCEAVFIHWFWQGFCSVYPI